MCVELAWGACCWPQWARAGSLGGRVQVAWGACSGAVTLRPSLPCSLPCAPLTAPLTRRMSLPLPPGCAGDRISASEALAFGLVTRVVPAASLVDEAVAMGAKMSSFSKPVIAMAKEAVNAAFEVSLAEGLRFERRFFHSTFATRDQKEGMAAFMEKRKPAFTDS